jgi:hypothetical protein
MRAALLEMLAEVVGCIISMWRRAVLSNTSASCRLLAVAPRSTRTHTSKQACCPVT